MSDIHDSNTPESIATTQIASDDAIPETLPYRSKGNLTEGDVVSHMLKLTLPMIWGLFAVISVQVVDTYFISLLGTRELAAVSFTFPVTMMISHVLFGFNIATSSVVSRLIGNKEREEAKRVTLHSLFLSLLAGSLLSFVAYIFLKPLFLTMGATNETLPIILEYMPVWLIASAVLTVPSNGNSSIRADGDSMKPALVMTFIAIVNVALDPLFIFGGFGFPALGVQGAALATLIAYIAGTFIGLYVLIYTHKLVSLDSLHLKEFGNSLKRLIVIAIPAGLTNAIQPIVRAILVSVFALYGEEAVAASGIVSRIQIFAMITIIALSTAIAPIVGQNWGAKKTDRVFKTINYAIGFNIVWSLITAMVMGFGANFLSSIFSSNPEVIRVAVLCLWIVPFSSAFGNLIFGWSSAFNAIGRPEWAFVMILSSAFMTIGSAFIGHWTYGLIGIFVGIAATNTLAGLIFHVLSSRIAHKMAQNLDK